MVEKNNHFDSIKKKSKEGRMEMIKKAYFANIFFKYLKTKIMALTRIEKAKVVSKANKRQELKGKIYNPNEVLIEIAKWQLENERFKQKIIAIMHTITLRRLGPSVSSQKLSHYPNYLSGVTGKTSSALNEDIQLMNMLEENVKEAKDELDRLSKYIKNHEGRSGDKLNKKKIANSKGKYEQQKTLILQYEKLRVKMDSIKKTVDGLRSIRVKQMRFLEEHNQKYSNLDQQAVDMRFEVQSQGDIDVDNIERDICITKTRLKDLESNIRIICSQPIFSTDEMRVNTHERLRDTQEQIVEVMGLLNSEQDTSNDLRLQKLELEAAFSGAEKRCEHLNDKLTEFSALVEFQETNKNNFENRRAALGDSQLNSHPKSSPDPEEFKDWYNLQFIERDEIIHDEERLRLEVERLILENGELASHLEKSRSLIEMQRDMEDEKLKIHINEIAGLDQQIEDSKGIISEKQMIIDLMLDEGRINKYEVHEVKYDDDDDMFDVSVQNDSHISSFESDNIFELHISGANFDSKEVLEILRLNRIAHQSEILSIIFLVKFYNFDYQYSHIYSGFVFQCDFLAVFTIKMNHNFLKYCMEDGFTVEIVGAIHGQEFKLGEFTVVLADLLKKNVANLEVDRNLVSISRANELIYSSQLKRHLGAVELEYRFRNPCGMTAKLYLEEKTGYKFAGNLDDSQKLIVKIKEVSGLDHVSESFVCYNLFEDLGGFSTGIVKGARPQFNYIRSHQIPASFDIVDKLDSLSVEFIVFDDSIHYRDVQDDEDVIGSVTVPLSPLRKKEFIEETITLRNLKTMKHCNLTICLYFTDLFSQLHASTYQGRPSISTTPMKDSVHVDRSISPYKPLLACLSSLSPPLTSEAFFKLISAPHPYLTQDMLFDGVRKMRLSINENEVAALWDALTDGGNTGIVLWDRWEERMSGIGD